MAKQVSTDVLIVGGGGAGFRAAIGVTEEGTDALLISKGPLTRSGATPMAGADLTCHGRGMRASGFFGEPRDSEDKFINDIVHQGCFLNDQKLTEQYVIEGPDRMREMIDWGIRVKFTDERAVFTPGTGIMDALNRQAKRSGVTFAEDVAILELLVKDGRVIGALGVDVKEGTFIVYDCKAVVLATGGWHRAFTPVTGSRELTGDGVAMAYRAGAELTDMEFITFCCNVIYWPPIYRGSIFTYVMGLLLGSELENADGDSIFEKYDPELIAYANHTEWNKCVISHISAREIEAGKASPHGGVFLRTGDTPWEAFEAAVQSLYPDWEFHGASFPQVGEKLKSGEGVEVGPGAEYFEGGIAVNDRYEASIPGLYAAGECAASVFGANRVAAATMEMLTTGATAGRSAGQYAQNVARDTIDQERVAALIEEKTEPIRRKDGARPAELRQRLAEISQEKLGPIRTEERLNEYLAFLADLKYDLQDLCTQSETTRYNKEWIEALNLVNMVQVQEMSARAALTRTESRGVHYRDDYPNTDNGHWLKQIVLKDQDGEPEMWTRPVTVTRMTPPTGVMPYLDMIKRMMEGHSDTGGHH
jgi:succinate dehydrogenase/fumarate reductase flavoprotein subunit